MVDMTSLPAFKEGVNPKSWDYIHPRIKEVFEFCEIMYDKMGLDCVITSTIRPKLDDTGIHATGRALDFVCRKRDNNSRSLMPADFMKFAATTSLIFIRYHTNPVNIFHSSGLGYHHHLQVSPTPGWIDLCGSLPNGLATEPGVVFPKG